MKKVVSILYYLQKRRSLFAIYFELYFQFIISGYEVEQYREGLYRERNREEEAYDKRDKTPNKGLALPPITSYSKSLQIVKVVKHWVPYVRLHICAHIFIEALSWATFVAPDLKGFANF